MKTTILVTTALLLSACPSQSAEKTANADPGLINSWVRKESPGFSAWDFGGQIRLRYEIKENAGSFPNSDFIRRGQDNDNSYFLLREKIHAGYKHDWVSIFLEGRDSSTTGDDRDPNPEADQFDLHQAFAVIGNSEQFPLSLKLGRQEMSYAEERFIGVSDWHNLSRVFDAAKLRFESAHGWIDGFIGRVVIPHDGSFNEVNDYDWFSGVYASTKTLIPKQETQLYVLSRNVSADSASTTRSSGGGAASRDVYTVGMRLKSLPGHFNGWDYGAEIAGQFGSVDQGGSRLDHEALALDVVGGYTWTEASGVPRLGMEYTYGSGDSDPTDNQHETFDLLFGTNHKLYGLMDLVGLRNIHNPSVSFSIKPMKNLSLKADYLLFWLAETSDSFYPEGGGARNRNGYGINPGLSGFVGSELDMVANYAFKPWLSFQAGYGHFFAGDYIRQSVGRVPANGGSTDADWVYLQTTVSF